MKERRKFRPIQESFDGIKQERLRIEIEKELKERERIMKMEELRNWIKSRSK